MLVSKALHGQTPLYICDVSTLYMPDHRLRSSDRNLLPVPESRLVMKDDQAFDLRGPKLWKSPPEDVRLAKSVSTFKSSLKTLFYFRAFS